MAFLPFFHSFGFTATLWASLICGVNSVFHPSPLEPKAIGELIGKYKAKFLIATPTFLQSFIRRCSREELQSLEFVVCGAEKLTPRIRDAFREKFGVEPLEGYGTTECGPAVAVCIPDFKAPGISQRGNKRGSVGRPLPGISVRTVHPDTGEILQHGEPGLLQVRGVNVMKGYLNAPEKTQKVLQDGWYSTGDIVSIDEEGFIFITDRLARFSKIAGEMVPHGKVEEVLHELLQASEQVLAVTGVPDQARGERLVVLHTLPNGQLEELIDRLDKTDLPNIWKPRLNAFYRIDEIPVLGTGKTDLKAVKALAAKLDQGE
jgi:acyl-[acyl-carrier-protein]-phospholipid O-acyltransferase/long-chain-fatty-acid--[acyl-carrier-protein] ligase